MTSVNDKLLEAVKARRSHGAEFGTGIITADRYVTTLRDCVGSTLCYRFAATRKTSFNDVIAKAAKTLVYRNEDMVHEETLWSKQAPVPTDQLPSGLVLPKNTLMVFKHVLTTPRKDRDGDILRTQGAKVDPQMLLLWQHVHTLPIGKMLAIAEQNSKVLRLYSAIVDMNELANDAAVMVDNGMGRFSHGFRALAFDEMKESEGETTSPGGFDVKEFEIMEESLVSVPSNVDAQVDEVILDLVDHSKLKSDLMKEWGKTIRDKRAVRVPVTIDLTVKTNGGQDGNATAQANGQTKTCGCASGRPGAEKTNGQANGQANSSGRSQVRGGPGSGRHPGPAHDATLAAYNASHRAPAGIQSESSSRPANHAELAQRHAYSALNASREGNHEQAESEHQQVAEHHLRAGGSREDRAAHREAAQSHLDAAAAHHTASDKSFIGDEKMSSAHKEHAKLMTTTAHGVTEKATMKTGECGESRFGMVEKCSMRAKEFASTAKELSDRGDHAGAYDAHEMASRAHNDAVANHDSEQANTPEGREGGAHMALLHKDAGAAHAEASLAHDTAKIAHQAASGQLLDPALSPVRSTKDDGDNDADDKVSADARESSRKAHDASMDCTDTGSSIREKSQKAMDAADMAHKNAMDGDGDLQKKSHMMAMKAHGEASDMHDEASGGDGDKHDLAARLHDKAEDAHSAAVGMGYGASARTQAKSGRVLNSRHLETMKTVHTDLTNLHGGGYGMNKGGMAIVEKCMGGVKGIIDVATPEGGAPKVEGPKGGRAISAKNLKVIKAVHEDLSDLKAGGYGMNSEGHEINDRCIKNCHSIIKESEAAMVDDNSAMPTAKDAAKRFLTLADKKDLATMKSMIDTIESSYTEEELSKEYEALLGATTA